MVDLIHGSLGDSDTVLKKSPITREREFIPTEIEWVMRNREQFRRSLGTSQSASGVSVVTLTTVPENQVLWLTSVSLNVQGTNGDAVNDSGCGVGISPDGSIIEVNLLRSEANPSATINTSDSVSYSPPLKIETGNRILLSAEDDFIAHATITGWLESRKIVP